MDAIKLSVLERTEKGNGPSRRLRVAGRVPGIVYGKGTEATPVAINVDSLRAAMAHGHNVVMELDFTGGAKAAKKGAKSAAVRYAVVKELQFHPTRRSLLHVDLHEVDLKVEIEATVSLELVGTPVGVTEGGIMEWAHREVVVRALPNDVPVVIQLDVSEIPVGQNLTVAALAAPKGTTIVDDPETMIVAVLAPRVQEEEVEAEEGAAEPEVVGEAAGAAEEE